MNNGNLKKWILYLLTVAIGLSTVIGLSAKLLEVSYLSLIKISDNGFSYLGFKSDFFDRSFGSGYITLSGIISWITLLVGIMSIVFTTLMFFKKGEAKKSFTIFAIACLACTISYCILGFVLKGKMKRSCKEFLYDSGYSYYDVQIMKEAISSIIKTKSYIPCIFVAIFFVGLILCDKYLFVEAVVHVPNGKGNPYAKMKEAERVETLLKYKELLDQQIITKEEFDEKRKELLFLTQNAPTNKSVERKKSTDQTKIETIRRYKELLDDGLLTEEEFKKVKEKLL